VIAKKHSNDKLTTAVLLCPTIQCKWRINNTTYCSLQQTRHTSCQESAPSSSRRCHCGFFCRTMRRARP